MYLSMTDNMMTNWLKTQVRILEAWREELSTRAEIDLGMVRRLEQHYQWLTSELVLLEHDQGPVGHC